MRKHLVALFALSAVMFSAGSALAEVPLTYVRENVSFRTTTNATTQPIQVQIQGYVDSTSRTQTGTAVAWTADTTASIRLFQPPPRTTASAADSVWWFNLYFHPAPTVDVTSSADSVYLYQQVSIDQVNWVAVTPTLLFYPANQMPTVVASNGPAVVIQELNGANGFIHQCKWTWAALGGANQVAENATTAPTAVQLAGFVFTRFIIVGDWGGRYVAEVYGPRSILSYPPTFSNP